MQDEVNTKVVAIAIKGGRITAEVLKKALAKFIEEIEKAEKQASQPKTYRGKQSIKHLVRNQQHRSDRRKHQVFRAYSEQVRDRLRAQERHL